MSPQIGSPLLGNLNPFDPFLTCSSHHLPQNNRSQSRGRLIVRNQSQQQQQQRSARSEPNSGVPSRAASMDRRASFLRTRAASTQGRTPNGGGSAPSTTASSAAAAANNNNPFGQPLDIFSLGRPELLTFSRMMSQFLGGGNVPPTVAAGGGSGSAASAAESAANQEVRGLMNMLTGVLGQVFGSLHGENSTQTIAEFLNSLPDYNYVQGDNLISDLLMALARRLTFSVSNSVFRWFCL